MWPCIRVLLALVIYTNIAAQDSWHIDTIVVSEEPLMGALDSINHTLHEVLQSQTDAFLIDHGPGRIATLRLQGAQATQTTVNWNGINLNSVATGLTDVSIVPVFLFDNWSIDHHGSGLAGSLDFNNKIPTQSSGHITAAYDSHLNSRLTSQLTYVSPKRNHRLYLNAGLENDRHRFKYNDDRNNRKWLNHTQTQQYATSLGYNWLLSKHHSIRIDTWWNEANREHPPSKSQAVSFATQFDRQSRLAANWSFRNQSFELDQKFFRIDDAFIYQDNSTRINTLTQSTRTGWQGIFKFISNAHRIWKISPLLEWQHGQSTGYSNDSTRVVVEVPLELAVTHKQHSLVLEALPVITNQRGYFGSQVVYKLSTKRRPAEYSAIYSYRFRLPSFDDLLWINGGQADIEPESARGITLSAQHEFATFSTQLNTFYRKVLNQIIWLPQSSGLYEPHNIQEAIAFGCYAQLDWKPTKKLTISPSYSFVRSYTSKTNLTNDVSLGKQIVYQPEHHVFMTIGYRFHQWQFAARQTYFSKRYTRIDHSQSLPGYYLLDVDIAYHWGQKFKYLAQLRTTNVTNTVYEVQPNRVTPPVKLELSFTFAF